MKLLVLNTSILAIKPTDTGDSWTTPDQIIPKHVAEGASIVDVALPDNFNTRDYTYENGALVYHAPVVVKTRDELKAERQAKVDAITVTTAAGHTFDGDETSQGRMARAVIALSAAPAGTTVNWVLHDNSVIQATAAELTEALALAGAAQAAIWVI